MTYFAGRPTKYTPEVINFLKENVNLFSTKDLCEALKTQFGIFTTPRNLQVQMSNHKIKRGPKVDKEIIDFILKSKIKNRYYMRDAVIIKFEIDIPMEDLRKIMGNRK